jgi:flagellar FliJ protein
MFQFKFTSVLNYRRQIEDVRQQEFAESKRLWEQEVTLLEQFHALWRTCLAEWRIRQNDAVEILEVELYQRYMLRLREEIRRQAEKVKERLAIMDGKRDILLQAQKERKVLDKLREYQHSEYRAAMLKKETAVLDEIATQRYNARGRKA